MVFCLSKIYNFKQDIIIIERKKKCRSKSNGLVSYINDSCLTSFSQYSMVKYIFTRRMTFVKVHNGYKLCLRYFFNKHLSISINGTPHFIEMIKQRIALSAH